jgi:hypothetical protein
VACNGPLCRRYTTHRELRGQGSSRASIRTSHHVPFQHSQYTRGRCVSLCTSYIRSMPDSRHSLCRCSTDAIQGMHRSHPTVSVRPGIFPHRLSLVDSIQARSAHMCSKDYTSGSSPPHSPGPNHRADQSSHSCTALALCPTSHHP